MASSSTRLIEILKRFPASSEDAQEPPSGKAAVAAESFPQRVGSWLKLLHSLVQFVSAAGVLGHCMGLLEGSCLSSNSAEGWTPITRKADGGKRFVSDNCQVYMRLRVLTKVCRLDFMLLH
eukprot:2002785-Amphidinium_carterae.1